MNIFRKINDWFIWKFYPRPYSKKAYDIFKDADKTRELNLAIIDERNRYEASISGENPPPDKSKMKVRRVGFGEFEEDSPETIEPQKSKSDNYTKHGK